MYNFTEIYVFLTRNHNEFHKIDPNDPVSSDSNHCFPIQCQQTTFWTSPAQRGNNNYTTRCSTTVTDLSAGTANYHRGDNDGICQTGCGSLKNKRFSTRTSETAPDYLILDPLVEKTVYWHLRGLFWTISSNRQDSLVSKDRIGVSAHVMVPSHHIKGR